jgi:hypothetical protein
MTYAMRTIEYKVVMKPIKNPQSKFYPEMYTGYSSKEHYFKTEKEAIKFFESSEDSYKLLAYKTCRDHGKSTGWYLVREAA